MRVIVGVSGGIAAYKACELVSRLVQAGEEVRVIMTPTATEFVSPLTFRALSGGAVAIGIEDEPEGPLSHITLSHWAQAMVVAPATASLLARLAQGTADNMLSLVYLGFRGPVLVAPAMEPDMWQHPRTEANVRILKEDGVIVVGPREGRLASGRTGVGRMADPHELVEALRDAVAVKDLAGVRMVVTAGATWEHFDPVRLLTNPSTGRMGVAIANQAARRGAAVVLVSGPRVNYPLHPAVQKRPVVSAVDMLEVVQDAIVSAEVYIGAAAVSDFRPAHPVGTKVHKESLGREWEMEPNPDVIRTIADQHRGEKLMVGFAAETEDAPARAEAKRRQKGLDAVVANLVGGGRGFGEGPHDSWLSTDTGTRPLGRDKDQAAALLLDWVAERIREGAGWKS